MNSRRIGAALIVVGLAVALWTLAATSTTRAVSPGSEPDTATNRLTVQTIAARREHWPDTIEAFGNVVPWDEIIVSAQVEGQPLVELCLNVGDHVRRGQVLARFDSRRLRTEILGLRAQVEQATAAIAQANAERDRATQLVDIGGISKQDLLQRVTTARVALATQRAARAQLATRELDLQRADVIAPDDGTISSRNAQTGMVGTTGLELFRIIRQDKLEWRGELTAEQLERAAPGQPVLLTLPGGATTRARIRQVAPAMNTQTRQAIAFADIEPGERVHAGTYVIGRILLGHSPACVVPASSIVVRDGYSFIFEVTPGQVSRVVQQRVDVGRRIRTEVEILTGLKAGERVVAQGAGFLDDGDLVHEVRKPSESHQTDDFQ